MTLDEPGLVLRSWGSPRFLGPGGDKRGDLLQGTEGDHWPCSCLQSLPASRGASLSFLGLCLSFLMLWAEMEGDQEPICPRAPDHGGPSYWGLVVRALPPKRQVPFRHPCVQFRQKTIWSCSISVEKWKKVLRFNIFPQSITLFQIFFLNFVVPTLLWCPKKVLSLLTG